MLRRSRSGRSLITVVRRCLIPHSGSARKGRLGGGPVGGPALLRLNPQTVRHAGYRSQAPSDPLATVDNRPEVCLVSERSQCRSGYGQTRLSALGSHARRPAPCAANPGGLQSSVRRLSSIAPWIRNRAKVLNLTCWDGSNLPKASSNRSTPAL
jgi:hypothetical protein